MAAVNMSKPDLHLNADFFENLNLEFSEKYIMLMKLYNP